MDWGVFLFVASLGYLMYLAMWVASKLTKLDKKTTFQDTTYVTNHMIIVTDDVHEVIRRYSNSDMNKAMELAHEEMEAEDGDS